MSVKTITRDENEGLSRVLPLIRQLRPLDKLRLIRILAEELEPHETDFENELTWSFEEEMQAWDLLSDEALLLFESNLTETDS